MERFKNFTIMFLLGICGSCLCAAEGKESAPKDRSKPKVVRDLIWVWGNPEMAEDGPHTFASYAQAGPVQRAQLLGVNNIMMAGLGLPNDAREAEILTQQVMGMKRILWEVAADGAGGPPFVYENRMALVRKLVDKYPRIEGIILDDMSSLGMDKGFKAEHIRNIRKLLPGKYHKVKIWGVVYTMNLDREGINDCIKEMDGILLCEWHAKDVVHLEKNIAHCERLFPDKPIMLGLYLYDYGAGRRIPLELLEKQCQTALKLAHAGRIKGMVFVTITNDREAVAWTADWVKQVGAQELGALIAEADSLEIGDGSGWSFPAGQWTEDEEGIISPPDIPNLHSRAFYKAQGFKDLTAEFEFNGNYRETGTGSAGLILRATDANHFYLVYFPWGGQQLRAKHFWAAIAKIDGDGYWRNIKAEWVPGVPSETDRWYKVRVVVEGSEISVWVDDRFALSVTDESYQSGCIGLAGYGWYFFRNINISGTKVPPPTWSNETKIPTHGFPVGLTVRPTPMPSGCIAPNGDVLLAAGNQLVRSRDKGRTWEKPETLPEKLGTITDYGNTMFCTSNGRLIVMMWRNRGETKEDVPQILICESGDNGRSWSDPVQSQVASGWPALPKSLTPYGPLTETEDGALLRFLLGGAREEGATFTDVRTWGATHCKAFAIRSTDGGKNWSAPIELDRPSWSGMERGSIPGSVDFTEPTGVAIGNKVTVLIRPIYSPYMWQCWSYDNGATWDAAVRTTFPGYAQSMVRTKSGAILCAHRYPHHSVNISYDDGLHWDAGTVIDFPAWAMGCMIEVEPDVVLCTYMNAQRSQPLLAQLIRITPKGIKPIRP